MLQSSLLSGQKNVAHEFCQEKEKALLPGAKSFYELTQIHSNKIIHVPDDYAADTTADGMVTVDNVQLSVKTADCLPILLYDRKKRIVAAVHAGWQGLHSGIIGVAIDKMIGKKANPNDILVAVGPHIKACCYTVSWDRVHMYHSGGIPNDIAWEKTKRWHLDLSKIATYQLLEKGIMKENIDIIPFCTSCDKRFRSFRREGKDCQRMYSSIKLDI
jgi:YfiH family protein